MKQTQSIYKVMQNVHKSEKLVQEQRENIFFYPHRLGAGLFS